MNRDASGGAPYDVTVDRDQCVSAGRCVASAPGFFRFDDEELSTVVPDGPRPSDDALERIARSCPNGAIRLWRDGVEAEL